MTTFIINTSARHEVHIRENLQVKCRLYLILMSHRLETNIDYTNRYPQIYTGCVHCYPEKNQQSNRLLN